MLSRLFWTMRRIWHLPSTKHEGCKPSVAYDVHDRALADIFGRWQFRYAYDMYRRSPKMLWWDAKATCCIVFWWLPYKQPLRCNGNHGGWRTRVCEWLESQARYWEEREVN